MNAGVGGLPWVWSSAPGTTTTTKKCDAGTRLTSGLLKPIQLCTAMRSYVSYMEEKIGMYFCVSGYRILLL